MLGEASFSIGGRSSDYTAILIAAADSDPHRAIPPFHRFVAAEILFDPTEVMHGAPAGGLRSSCSPRLTMWWRPRVGDA